VVEDAMRIAGGRTRRNVPIRGEVDVIDPRIGHGVRRCGKAQQRRRGQKTLEEAHISISVVAFSRFQMRDAQYESKARANRKYSFIFLWLRHFSRRNSDAASRCCKAVRQFAVERTSCARLAPPSVKLTRTAKPRAAKIAAASDTS